MADKTVEQALEVFVLLTICNGTEQRPSGLSTVSRLGLLDFERVTVGSFSSGSRCPLLNIG
jgi:hypothetical protein